MQKIIDNIEEGIERGKEKARLNSELNTLLCWRDCQNELPSDDNEVLIIHKNYNCYFIGTYYAIGQRWRFRHEIGHVDESEITYWMPLPTKPV